MIKARTTPPTKTKFFIEPIATVSKIKYWLNTIIKFSLSAGSSKTWWGIAWVYFKPKLNFQWELASEKMMNFEKMSGWRLIYYWGILQSDNNPINKLKEMLALKRIDHSKLSFTDSSQSRWFLCLRNSRKEGCNGITWHQRSTMMKMWSMSSKSM